MKSAARARMTPELREIFRAAAAMTEKGEEPHKHHLVPRFYLERWAEHGQVLVTELGPPKKSFLLKPLNALYETDYYRVTPGVFEGGSPVVWEAWLQKIESEAAVIFATIDDKGLESLTEAELGLLIYFIGVQATRSRSFRYQSRWWMGPGYFAAFELDKPGALEAHLERAGEIATPRRLAELRAYFDAVCSDPWQVPMSPELDLKMAMDGARVVAESLRKRRFVMYRTAKPLVPCDEPVVLLYESMAVDHPSDGGYDRAPIVVLPFGPHQVLAMFHPGMPVLHDPGREIRWDETLELNRAIAGNAHRSLVELSDGRLGRNLYIPDPKPPARLVTLEASKSEAGEILWMPSQCRWSGEPDAPVRPVASWWPA